jgi:fluoroquinolone transport system permease protein
VTWLDIARGLVVTDTKHIVRDRFIAFVLAYSLVLAAAVRFGVPPLANVLAQRYGIDLVPYYSLISSFVALTAGASLVGLVLGFLLLDARETRVLDALSVTPLTFDRFVTYRVVMPMILAAGLNPLCAWIGGIGLPGVGPMIVLALVGVPFAGMGTLALATFADNKVQAFAVLKIVSGVGMLPMAAYFIEGPLQYVFGLFPPYWIFKAWWVAAEGGSRWWAYALIGVFTNVVLLGWMKRRFERVMHGQAPSAVLSGAA